MEEVSKPHTVENHHVDDSDDEVDENIEMEEFNAFEGGAENNVDNQHRGHHETSEGNGYNTQAAPTSVDTTPVFSPGFTPASSETQPEVVLESQQPLSERARNATPQQPSGRGRDLRYQIRCLRKRLDEAIEYSRSIGFDMDGCERDMEKLIAGIGVHRGNKCVAWIWSRLERYGGNSRFDFASSLARGLSGGILCVWDPTMFVKNRIVSHDHFVAVEGNWCNGNVM
ncbi:hypothetical protein CTI12_AA318590 [Artemisia annua]|uniref:Uncharacterized protein n=1 Tax=Artemisia annua TaxID=35608 RepID=A0A2U1N1N7_ARTAN|nr:hypothetical protein CTI12_AA318590 [Artemisia annua]